MLRVTASPDAGSPAGLVPAHWQYGLGPAAAVGEPDGEAGAIADAGLRVKVEIMAPGNAGNRTFFIAAGEGQQRVRWLAMAATQRFAHARPHGQRRVGEQQAFAFDCQPGSLTVLRAGSKHPEVVEDPDGKLSDLELEYGDTVQVHLGTKFDERGSPLIPVRHGVPRRSPFHKASFKGTPERATLADAREQKGAAARLDLDTVLEKRREQREAMLALEFKALMCNQGTFHNMLTIKDDDDPRSDVELAVDYEMGHMALGSVIVPRSTPEGVTIPSDEIAAVREVFVQFMPVLNDVFRFYCGMSDNGDHSAGEGGGTATMSRLEFCAWIGSTQLYNVSEECAELAAIFALENHIAEVMESDAQFRGLNPTGEFMRFEFLECLVRVAMLKFNGKHPPIKGHEFPKIEVPADALRRVIEEFVVPHAQSAILSNEVRKLLMVHDVQVMLQSVYEPLLVVYQYYASADVRARAPGARPTMDLGEFQHLVMDAALVDEEGHESSTSADGHAGLSPRDARSAFAQSQGDSDVTTEELSELLFCEFVEALTRIALQKWNHRKDISERDKIGFATDAVVRLLPEIKRGGISHEAGAAKS